MLKHAVKARPRKHLRKTITARISRSEGYYVAECLDIAVVTQGKTMDEVLANLREAVGLHLEDENLTELGLAPHPNILVTMEIEPALA